MVDVAFKQECGACAFWRRRTDEHGASLGGGYCVRFPPIFKEDDRAMNDGWPFVHQQSWCGEFKRHAGRALAELNKKKP